MTELDMLGNPLDPGTLERARNKGVREMIDALALMGSGDEYGDVMGALFPLAAYLYFEREGDGGVPDAWEFVPGAATECAPEDWEMIRDMFFPAYDTETLLRFGETLRTRRDICAEKGTDY